MAHVYPAQGPTSYLAGANLNLVSNRFVKLDTTAAIGGTRVVLCGAGDACVGVMAEGATTNAAVAVQRAPARPKVSVAATITAGQAVASNATGQAVPATAGARIAGWAESAAATSSVVTVSLAGYGGTA